MPRPQLGEWLYIVKGYGTYLSLHKYVYQGYNRDQPSRWIFYDYTYPWEQGPPKQVSFIQADLLKENVFRSLKEAQGFYFGQVHEFYQRARNTYLEVIANPEPAPLKVEGPENKWYLVKPQTEYSAPEPNKPEPPKPTPPPAPAPSGKKSIPSSPLEIVMYVLNSKKPLVAIAEEWEVVPLTVGNRFLRAMGELAKDNSELAVILGREKTSEKLRLRKDKILAALQQPA